MFTITNINCECDFKSNLVMGDALQRPGAGLCVSLQHKNVVACSLTE